MAAVKGRKELIALMDKLSLQTTTIEHPAVFTVDAMMEHLGDIEGVVSKNLFLKDKKKKLWLLTAAHDGEVKLADIAKKVGAPGGLRFADEAIMMEKLGVAQGCCTPLALFNDVNNDVRFIMDSAFTKDDDLMGYYHPLENTATLGLKWKDFKLFLDDIKHEAVIVDL